jgi:hypothetical protein
MPSGVLVLRDVELHLGVAEHQMEPDDVGGAW